MNKALIGKRLSDLRGDESQESLAKKLGISRSALAMYEQGNRLPRDEIKIKIAKYHNKSVQEIFFD